MSMNIGELAALTGCQVVTIRYYEKTGLLAAPARSRSGYRLYTDRDVDRLRFIRHCRDHDIALSEIKILLDLQEAPDHDCSVVSELVDRHIRKVEERIESLLLLKEQLVRLRKRCPHGGPVASCGIMRGLTDRELCGCRAAGEGSAAFEAPEGPRAAAASPCTGPDGRDESPIASALHIQEAS